MIKLVLLFYIIGLLTNYKGSQLMADNRKYIDLNALQIYYSECKKAQDNMLKEIVSTQDTGALNDTSKYLIVDGTVFAPMTNTDSVVDSNGTTLTDIITSLSLDYITEYSSSNNSSWYRLWKSGFKECGVYVTGTDSYNTTTITFPVTFSDTKYFVSCENATVPVENMTGGTFNLLRFRDAAAYVGMMSDKTTNSVVVSTYQDLSLYACGY